MDGTLALQGMGDRAKEWSRTTGNGRSGDGNVSRKVWVVADTRQFCCLG
jgi:hypothetical protein